MVKHFRKGSAVYKCNVCGRGTRDTGVQSLGNKLCPQCYELAGIENSISDGYETMETMGDTIRRYVADIVAKGGNVSDWNDTFGLDSVKAGE
jgi:hypothetical protein